jgi:superfamily II DNA or RNA helicase
MSLRTPTKLYLPRDGEDVSSFLTFRDRSVDYQIGMLKRNFRWRGSDPEGFAERMEALKAQSKRCLLMRDQDGAPFTYSGLADQLGQRFGWGVPAAAPVSPDRSPIAMARSLPDLFYYQAQGVDALCRIGHGGIELPTGSGKSVLIMELLRRCPVKSLVVTPSAAITDQLYNDLVHFFGQKHVGKYGDGSKKFGKRFTVATAQALTRLEPGDPAYEDLASSELFLFDESHMCPADTFEKVCMGLAGRARYRFFTSATQMRSDGSEMLLRGITGPIVYRKTFRELCAQGYLAKPHFKIFSVHGMPNANHPNPQTETRRQLYLNPHVNQLAGEIATKSVLIANRPTLVIVEQFDQFMQLKNFLGVPCVFVHGGVDKRTKQILAQEHWNVDAGRVVADFNARKLPLVVGTSAIATGVDTKVAETIVYLQGGTSEVKVRQAIGRGTRIKGVAGKQDLWVADFRVAGSDTMDRHTDARRAIYDDMSDEVVEIGRDG